MNRKYFLIFAVLTSFIFSCTPPRLTGKYTQNPESKPSFAGREFAINEDGTFSINEYSDTYAHSFNEDGDIECLDKKGKGYGIYEVNGDSITLNFENKNFVTLEVSILENNQVYRIYARLIDEHDNPLPAESIAVMDKEDEIVEAKIFNLSGVAHFSIHRMKEPSSIQVDVFGGGQIKVDISENLGTSTHKIKRCIGYFHQGDSLTLWYKASRKHLEYNKDGVIRKLRRVN